MIPCRTWDTGRKKLFPTHVLRIREPVQTPFLGRKLDMKVRRILVGSLVLSLLLLCASVYAQVSRPYRNGSVWSIAMIRVKPGMNEAYMNYLTGQWKANQEAAKKEKLILSYKVLSTEAHGSEDWNLLLLTEYKDLATMEANEPKEDAVSQRVIGD